MSRTTLAILSILLAASAAHAQPAATEGSAAAEPEPRIPGWRFDLGSEARWLRDRSAAAVTTDALASFVLSVERHLATIEVPRADVELAAFATWDNGEASGTMFKTLDTTIGTNDLFGGVHASARMFRVVRLSARAGVGATRAALTIAPIGQPSMASVDDHGWGSLASGSLGVDFEPIALPLLRLGIGAELGYVATSGVTMHAYPTGRGDPDLTIETAYASIGRLDLDGWSLRIGAHLAF